MTISRRDLLRSALVLGSAAALGPTVAGCATRSAAAPPMTSGDVDLLFWTHDQGYIDFFSGAVELADRATSYRYSLQPLQIAADDLVTKLIAQAVAGRGMPDVAGLEIGNFARLLRGDLAPELLEPLDGAVADVRDDLIEARLAPFSRDGHLYALDSDVPMVVYYRRDDVFTELGIPTEFESWEELARIGAKVHDKTGQSLGTVVTGTDLGQVVQQFWIPLLQRGGGLFDADGELSIETPEAEEVLTFLVDGVQSGFLSTVSDVYGPAMQAALKQGRILGIAMPSWYEAYGLKPNVPEQAGAWRIGALPPFAGGGGRTSVGGGTGFAAVTGSPRTAASADFVAAAYLDPDQQVRRFKDLGYLPTRRSAYQDQRLLTLEDDYLGGQRAFEVFADLVDEAPAVYLSPDIQILNTVLAGALVDAYRGRSTPSQALTQAAETFRSQADR
ncbi:ABC transporter substrate-binding protein [Isoptericola sp. NPDC056134]|uniref:ABC transporter substrate-binding protein n=1 Tax=Isoptericola sp. NPDC056134 TaxID=3345723 RepID=UPI0035F07C05